MKRPSKYRNLPTVVDGIRFASKAEARRYSELRILEKGGFINHLARQVRFSLLARNQDGANILIEKYVADFVYRENGQLVVEDVKGMRTKDYRRKRRWMKLVLGLEIREVNA